jgi:uncharacterized protein YoxC
MTAGQLAALIAAGFFALLVIVACYVLLRIARLLTAATGLVTGYRERADTLIEQAQAVVDRTNDQLTRTDAITASMDEVTANMAELSGHVSAMTGLARALTGAVGAPVTGISAVAYGVRRAVALRRPQAVAPKPAQRRPQAVAPEPALRQPEAVAPEPALRQPEAVVAAIPGDASRDGRPRRPERMAGGLRGARAPRSGGPGVTPRVNTGGRR